MSYIPSEEALNQYEEQKPSFAHSYKDYLQGLGSGLLQSGAEGGRYLAMTPSYLYEAITGKPGYNLVKPDVLGFAPDTEAGQTGKEVGITGGDIISLMAPGSWAKRGLQAFTKYHPLTKGQMGRQFRSPEQAAEKANLRNFSLPNNDLFEVNELLSHPALEAGGATGRALTPAGRQALIQGLAEGRYPAAFSSQSLLGDLERAIPKMGEQYLAKSRVRPMKEKLLENINKGLIEGGLPEEAQNLKQARAGARRYYKTKKTLKKIAKPLSLASIMKAAMAGAKNIP